MYNGTLGAKHTGHRTKQRKQQHRKIHSPLSLHYVLFGQGGDQLRRLERVFEDSPISLLPVLGVCVVEVVVFLGKGKIVRFS